MARDPKDVAERLLALSEKSFVGLRRPDITLDPEVVKGVMEALERSPGGLLIIRIEEAVDLFGIHPSYKDHERATLLSSSLSRKLGYRVSVGTRERGRYLTFRLKPRLVNE